MPYQDEEMNQEPRPGAARDIDVLVRRPGVNNRRSRLLKWLLVSLAIAPVAAFAGSKAHLFEAALTLQPDLENGRKIYTTCVVCHGAEGWGLHNGNYPQIAGQLKAVVIKQLADIKAGIRGNPMMYPFTTDRILPDAQTIADVSAYIEQLAMAPTNGIGPGFGLQRAQQQYREYCADCHGGTGEGEIKRQIPSLYGQHYNYLVRQFNWIRNGTRRNADKEMIEQIRDISERDWMGILDYTSRLRPPAAKLARPGWRNPDFKLPARSGGVAASGGH